MKDILLPLSKADVHYDAARGEVTLSREKFDGLVRFATEILEQLQETENSRDVTRSRLRQSTAETGILRDYVRVVKQAEQQVNEWIDNNSVQELSRRTKIPYATCHRIIHSRLPQGKVDPASFEKILDAIQQPAAEQRASARADR